MSGCIRNVHTVKQSVISVSGSGFGTTRTMRGDQKTEKVADALRSWRGVPRSHIAAAPPLHGKGKGIEPRTIRSSSSLTRGACRQLSVRPHRWMHGRPRVEPERRPARHRRDTAWLGNGDFFHMGDVRRASRAALPGTTAGSDLLRVTTGWLKHCGGFNDVT